jgi:hypothetical protein
MSVKFLAVLVDRLKLTTVYIHSAVYEDENHSTRVLSHI